MAPSIDRRHFLREGSRLSAAMVAAIHIGRGALDATESPNERLNIAAIGVANKGRHNIDQLTRHNIVALCDVDANYLAAASVDFPGAKTYQDYRRLFDQESQRIDAVVVSTADHTHAPATSVALQLGKHVYCEKPLTHTVAEARAIARLAKKQKVATQMGIQIHAEANYRRAVELVRGGAIGDIKEVYCWCNKGWADGRFHFDSGPPPKHLDWDLWQGPAPDRKYSDNLHPANWRRFWQYGSGTFGDMACHVMDLPFWALELDFPTRVHCEGPAPHPDGAPAWCLASYDFPRQDGSILKFHWADGEANFDLVKQTNDADGQSLAAWGLGILFVGAEGMLVADYGRRQLLPTERFRDDVPPEPTIPDSIGHWNEWTEACKHGGKTSCDFSYAGKLTETVLLGIVAFRSGAPLEWNAANLTARGSPTAQSFVSKAYRRGFEVIGLD